MSDEHGFQMPISLWKRNGYEISIDPGRLDRDWLLGELQETYWAKDNAPETLWSSIQNARSYGVYSGDGHQVGYCRVVTDGTRFAWVSDVLLGAESRGLGLGKWLMEVVTTDPALERVNLWMLATDDAHGLYEQFGFEKSASTAAVEKFMHLRRAKR